MDRCVARGQSVKNSQRVRLCAVELLKVSVGITSDAERDIQRWFALNFAFRAFSPAKALAIFSCL